MTAIESIAWKWDDAFAGQEYPDDDPERHEVAKADARWWFDSIADEVRAEAERRKTPGNFAGHFCTVSEWLRSQANK